MKMYEWAGIGIGIWALGGIFLGFYSENHDPNYGDSPVECYESNFIPEIKKCIAESEAEQNE